MPRSARLAVVIVAVLAGLAQLHPLNESDLWWHLRGGAEVLAQGTWNVQDHSSFLQDGWRWEDAEWGFQVLALGLWRAIGPDGVVALVAVVAAAGAWCLGELGLRLAPERPWTAVGVAALASAACVFDYTARPQIFNLTFVALAMLLLEGPLDAERVVALVVLQLVWAHLHSSHVLLPALALCGVLDGDRRRGLTLAGGLGAISLLLGPLGTDVIGEVADHADTESARWISDMHPPALADWLPHGIDPSLATLLVLALAVGRLLLGPAPRASDIGRLALGLALAMTATRFRSLAAMLAVPLVLRGLPAPETALARISGLLLGLVAIPAVALAAARADASRAPGLGVWTPSLPVVAADLLDRYAKGARVYASYGDGGYLAWRLAPDTKIAIDGRTPTFFDPRGFMLVEQSRVSRRTLHELLDAYDVGWALLPRDHQACADVRDDPAWRVVAVDRDRVLLTRGDALPGVDLASLARCGAEPAEDDRCADPGALAAMLADLDVLERLGGEGYAALARIRLAGCPGGPDPRTLAPLVPLALAQDPDRDDVERIARLLVHLGEPDEALALLDAGVPDAGTWALRGRILAAAGRFDEAAVAWDEAARIDGFTLPLASRLEYARVLVAAGRLADAAEQARRCAWAGDPAAEALLDDLLPRLDPDDRDALTPFVPKAPPSSAAAAP